MAKDPAGAIKVKVELSSSLRSFLPEYDPRQGVSLALPLGGDVAGLIESLGIPPKEITVIMVNRRPARPGQILADGDLVGLFPALGGG